MSCSLVVRDVSYSLGPVDILSGLSLVVGPQSRVGVVGPNGSGKTTLLRLLAGEIEPTRGSISLSPPIATIGYIAQERDRRPGERVEEALLRRTGIAAASDALDVATAEMAAGRAGSAERYADALERWLALGGGEFAGRVESVLSDVGLEPRVLAYETDSVSGGELARVVLASIVLGSYDLVLLDEPTNDLDFAGLALLERFVVDRSGGVVVVSHDRAFLERTITSVLEIDEHAHTATLFNGGWAAYREERATARAHAEEAYALFKEQRRDLEARRQRQREWAVTGVRRADKRPKDNDRAQRDFRQNRTEKLASKVRITERQLDRLDAVEKPWEPWQLNLSIAATQRSGDVVALLSGAVVERDEFTLGPIDLEIGWAERVALVGPNGSGKTTLIHALLGRVPLTSGVQLLGKSVVVGELDQRRALLAEHESVLRAFRAATNDERPDAELRSLLAKFGLGAEHILRPVATLSPGERTRVLLALFMARGVNFLVLDEPTNHLDLPAIEQLEMALDAWDATLLLVTHDRRLLESVELDTTVPLELGSQRRA